ncbi:hypothetical protein NQ176_g6751 [Zarea fungicola]|uniref:Uncharacterized protein n=1 Tax=Zarea fungicola TaxID=93591 RepID=A0ACC1N2Q1_9HYPO|nr:hypothetical protein NQ176_g6751 [Lecanicillium fungicola]
MEKFRSDFNSSSKGAPDRVAQIRIGINDVPYDMLPRVVPVVPSGYNENEQDAERAWNELVTKFKNLILSSFDQRVTQYEEDIKEKDVQRTLPGWNFCTFFILKEGLALGFENVGLVEDALVGYDELNVGLDLVLAEQAETGEPESHGGAMLPFTEDLRLIARNALGEGSASNDEEAVDLQSTEKPSLEVDDIPISAVKKAYRDMILANKVSVFDFRCYIFSRQIALLLRQANTSVTREQLLSRLKEQQESVLHGVAPMAKATPLKEDDTENLAVLAEICQRTLEFVPSLSNVMRHDIITSLSTDSPSSREKELSPDAYQVIDNLVSSFAFSIAQQILAQTATKALPIPPSSLPPANDTEQKMSIPEPKTMMHPARNSSLNDRSPRNPPPSPGFPGPGRAPTDDKNTPFLKTGIEELAAGRAELYMMSRSILQRLGRIRGWSTGWDEAPIVHDSGIEEMEEISLDDDDDDDDNDSNDDDSIKSEQKSNTEVTPNGGGIRSQLLLSATENSQDFYRLYEILTDKALRHYTVADQQSTVQTTIADLAVLKFFLKEYAVAKAYFDKALQFFSESGWSMIELSMLVMYLQCLSERNANLEYVRAALQLLTMSSAAEFSRIQDSSARRLRPKQESEDSPIKGIVAKLCNLASSLRSDVRSPLSLFFTNVELLGTPVYDEGRDRCSITISLWSLLPDDITLDRILLKVSGVDEGPIKDLTFESKGDVILKPGKNKLTVSNNSVIPGKYKVNHFGLHAGRLFLHYDADVNTSQSSAVGAIFKQPEFTLYQHSRALDVDLKAAKHTALDKNNSLDLTISTGWNSLKRCEVRIRPNTGGLRLLTTETKVVDSQLELAKPPEAGTFIFNAVASDTSVTLRFPFSTELDLDDVFARIEVNYVTDADESYHLAKSFSVPVSLAVGVNVQDVFKHGSLFSRFNVTTATTGPLRLYKSELLDSELFAATSGAADPAPRLLPQ